MNFSIQNLNLKKKKKFFGRGDFGWRGGGGGGGA